MPKNPILNAVGAAGYIVLVATGISVVTQTLDDKPDSFLAPVAFLSLLTLSAAVMAFLFFYQPLQLLIAGKKKEAIDFFLQTLGVFGILTLVLWIIVLSGLL